MRAPAILVVIVAAVIATAADARSPVVVNAVVKAAGQSFTPESVQISTDGTVSWENAGGIHNVVFDDGSYTSGTPTSNAKLGERTFQTVGTYRYYCEVHGSKQSGMRGEVVVVDKADPPTPTPTPTATATVLPNAALKGVSISRKAGDGRVHGQVTVEPFDQPGAELTVTVARNGAELRSKTYPSADGLVEFALKLPKPERQRLVRKGKLKVVVVLETAGAAARREVVLKP